MKRILSAVVCLILLVVTAGSTGAAQSRRGAGLGAITGGAAGAILGGAIGGDAKGALIGAAVGAAVGALAGAIIGNYLDRQERNAMQTAQVYDYQPSQGAMVRVEDVRVEPEVIVPGRPSKLVMTYAILERNPSRPLPVTERRQIISGQEMLKEIGPKTVDRVPGTYYSEQEVTFPKNLPRGHYAMKGVVEAAGKSSQQEAFFKVARIPTDSGYAYRLERIPNP
ncbi:MAG: hypothetical protein GX443_00960 [Deltaproteobacteria bacterium]|nr:hypothetical protein [Deltaproteobacteria bacterium]